MPRVGFTFDPYKLTGEPLPKGADRQETNEQIAEFVREQVLTHMDRRTSPVAGHGKFEPLSKDYKKRKQAAGLPGVPDLEFSGDLKAAIDTRASSRSVRLEVTGDQAPKADGHCNLSGRSKLPTPTSLTSSPS